MFPNASDSEEISPQQLQALRAQGASFHLIDCREDDEWDYNRIEGAKHAALSRFAEQSAALRTLTDLPVVIYCHHGIRSLHATRLLRQTGLTEVFSLHGGIDRWSRDIDAAVPLY